MSAPEAGAGSAGGIVLAWYYHLPAVCGDGEVEDLARASLLPLLNLHQRLERPLVLAVTGSLLERLRSVCPETLAAARDLRAAGLCEIAATCLYEIHPPALPLRLVRRHLVADLAVKERLLEVRPRLFHPPNFTWIAAFRRLLPELGLGAALLDEGHFRLAASTQTWRWRATGARAVETVLLDARLDRREIRRPFRHVAGEDGGDGDLLCFFRDFEAVGALSFGNSGCLHRPFDGEALAGCLETANRAAAAGELLTLADDGDRVNPVSLAAYRAFLEGLEASRFRLPGSLEVDRRSSPEVAYLPSYSLAGEDFWRGDADARHYLALLDEVHRRVEGREGGEELEEEMLELHDVFFLFWKTVARKAWYIDRLYALWHRLEGGR